MSNLKERSVKGVSWNLVEQFGLQGVRFVFGVILARLLTPDDFGLIGMITVFFTIAQIFIDGGFSLSYIQKGEVTKEDANTIFFTNLGVSIILYAIFWFTAPFIASFYNQPLLLDLTRVMALVLVVNSFNIIQMAQVIRAIDFKLRAKIILASTILSGSIGITCAYLGLGVWSLVVQQMANRIITTIGFWISSKWRPSLLFSTKSFSDMFSFGGWILLTGIIRTTMDNIYTLVIGKLFPVAQLGYYTKSKQLQHLASQNLTSSIGAVSFPVFSKLQHDHSALKRAMHNFSSNAMFFIVPIMVGLLVVAEPFILILLTEKWAPSIPFLQLLCLVGYLYPLHMVNVQALTAIGKARQSMVVEVVKNLLRLANIVIMHRFGVLYIIMGEVVVSLLSLYVNTFYIKRYLSYGLVSQLLELKLILIGGLLAGIAGYSLNLFIENLFIQLFAGIFIVTLTYGGFHYIFNRKQIKSILELVKLFKNK
jgi:O-antigen/teichoic acid export membrane protein